jgi:hypothetical protein
MYGNIFDYWWKKRGLEDFMKFANSKGVKYINELRKEDKKIKGRN